MDIWTSRVFQHAGLFYLPVLLYLSSTACSSPADRARQELTRRGIEPNTESFNRNVDSGNAEVVALLVDAGIQPRLALRRAARNGRCEIVELLLDKGYDPTGIQAADALSQSMAHHSEECARKLREVGADLRARDLRGENLLTLAAREGTPQWMKELLDLGLSVDEPNRSGETAAIVAAQANRADQMEVLIAAETDVNAADPDGWRALTYAARAGHGDV
ncbi:MAG TPA: ankyrin repeat domain-containing protein, partial [Vicinamibacteria bacterium]|nr:ankyrin repeat domain-containing protein [Vicinamibacteria bacterium]